MDLKIEAYFKDYSESFDFIKENYNLKVSLSLFSLLSIHFL